MMKIFNNQYSTKESSRVMLNFQSWRLLIIFVLFFSCREVNSQPIPKWKITDLEEYIARSDTPVIINFWATYCVPCIKEIPYFQEIVKQYEKEGVKLLLVSLDFKESFPDKISSFADKRKFTSPIVWLDETDADYFCPKVDSKWSGVMPATLFINNKKGHRSFFEEEMSEEQFESEIRKILNSQ